MVVEGITLEGQEDQVPPPAVGRRLRLEDNRDQKPDVLDTTSLVVKLGHERVGRIVPEDRRGVSHVVAGRVGGCGPDVGRGRKAKGLLRFGDLAGQGIGRISLAFPSDGSLMHAGQVCRRSGPGIDEGSGKGGVGRWRRAGKMEVPGTRSRALLVAAAASSGIPSPVAIAAAAPAAREPTSVTAGAASTAAASAPVSWFSAAKAPSAAALGAGGPCATEVEAPTEEKAPADV